MNGPLAVTIENIDKNLNSKNVKPNSSQTKPGVNTSLKAQRERPLIKKKQKPKVLYVDDEQINTMLFKINFSEKYEVYTASSGLEGLSYLNKEPDILVIISDMKMPGLNGIEFIKKAKEKFPSKKYFILTGFEITPEIQSSLENGLILKYFRKPFNIKEIEAEIEKHTNNS